MPRDTKPAESLASTLANHRVWGVLSAADREALEPLFASETLASSAIVMPQGQLHTRMGLILSGDITLVDPDLGLKVRLQAGEIIGFGATPQHQLSTWQANAPAVAALPGCHPRC